MSDKQWRPPTWASFNLTDVETGEPYTIKPSTVTIRLLIDLIEKWGMAQARELLLFGASLVKRETSERDVARLSLILDALPRSVIGESEDLEDFVLWRSYTWLLEKQINRRQAAQYASDVLGREISTDAWRMAVDRWAKKQHFPKVEYRTRRTAKQGTDS